MWVCKYKIILFLIINTNPSFSYQKLKKFCEKGVFYFSYEYPLTLSLQKQHELGEDLKKQVSNIDIKWIWASNRNHSCLVQTFFFDTWKNSHLILNDVDYYQIWHINSTILFIY